MPKHTLRLRKNVWLGKKKRARSVFALAGAIGIEPTQWESEAQVLPLHQAPSRVLLYINAQRFAIDFANRK